MTVRYLCCSSRYFLKFSKCKSLKMFILAVFVDSLWSSKCDEWSWKWTQYYLHSYRTYRLEYLGPGSQTGIGKHFHGDLRIKAQPSSMLPSPVSAEWMLLDANREDHNRLLLPLHFCLISDCVRLLMLVPELSFCSMGCPVSCDTQPSQH